MMKRKWISEGEQTEAKVFSDPIGDGIILNKARLYNKQIITMIIIITEDNKNYNSRGTTVQERSRTIAAVAKERGTEIMNQDRIKRQGDISK